MQTAMAAAVEAALGQPGRPGQRGRNRDREDGRGDLAEDDWNRIFAINVTGTFLTLQARPCPCCALAGGGSIINFGSYDGFIADPGLAAYCATKGAVHALTRAMACDHGPESIRVNAICPGYIDTPMLQSFFGSGGRHREPEGGGAARAPPAALRHAGRRGQSGDLAGVRRGALRLSGQLWVLDGGLTAQAQQMRL